MILKKKKKIQKERKESRKKRGKNQLNEEKFQQKVNINESPQYISQER